MDAFVYGFPFWIYIDSANPPKDILLSTDDGDVRLYTPFRSSPGNFSMFPKINVTKIPGIKYGLANGAMLPDPPVYVPSLNYGEKENNIYLVFNETYDHLPQETFPMDSLRVDFLFDEKERNSRFEFVKRFLEIVRLKTG